jgi:hypothetical protein
MSRSEFDRQQLLQRLDQQLQALGDDASTSGRKWVILIDGLDHIPRELQVVHSMLRDLPHPDRVPPGVFILLGSQTTELSDLPQAVRTVLRETERRLEIRPLTRLGTAEVVRRRLPIVHLKHQQLDRIHARSQKSSESLVFVHKSEVGERRVDVTEFIDWCVACRVDPDEAFRTLRKSRG